MKYKTLVGILSLALVPGLVGCDNAVRSPTASTDASGGGPAPSASRRFMQGRVSDIANRPLARAAIEVLDGPEAGLSTTADAGGQFTLTGIFDGATRFRAAADGHAPSVRTEQPNGRLDFYLEGLTSPIDIGGDYTLTFAANATCTMLPEDMRSRTFTATLPVTSSALRANAFFRVGGATFFEDWDAISIAVAGDYMALWLETLVEQITPNSFLAFGGQAAAAVDTSSTSTIVLPFHGSIDYCVTAAEHGRYLDCYQSRATVRRCESSHQLTLTRR
jgi:hypothetical protein